MSRQLIHDVEQRLIEIEQQGLLKQETPILSPQSSSVAVMAEGRSIDMLNLCSNNYLGLANDPELKQAAHNAIDSHGFGMASVRFICGTQDLHKDLEKELAQFLGVEDTILFASCFDANAGIFEALLGQQDAIISDQLNHASIIDGVRLCKARRLRYANNDMAELEACLQQAQDAHARLIVTDGVFSMDGIIANLPEICELAERYDALVMVDDSHSVGFMGPHGSGTPDHWHVRDKVALLSGTFGKALGGAAGGYIGGPKPLVDLLRQKARPYLFSNSVPPAIVAATLAALKKVSGGESLREKLRQNASYFRQVLGDAGFDLVAGEHPIIPIMLGDAVLAQQFAAELKLKGIYVTAFSYPVVPKGKARIRTQMSAAHSMEDLARATTAFIETGKTLGVIEQPLGVN